MPAVIFNAVILVICVSVPLLLLVGWVRWAKGAQPHTLPAVMALISFMLATASALIAISTVLYALAIRSFPFYDPVLLTIYGCGALLSFLGVVVGIGGMWGPSPMRWYAPVVAVGTLLF